MSCVEEGITIGLASPSGEGGRMKTRGGDLITCLAMGSLKCTDQLAGFSMRLGLHAQTVRSSLPPWNMSS